MFISWFIALLFVIIILQLLVMLSAWFSKPRHTLGVDANGRLALCDNRPNSYASEEKYGDYTIIPASENPQEVLEKIKQFYSNESRSQLVTEQGEYLHFTTRSKVYGFLDDNEFVLSPDQSQILYRLSARMGRDDLGANKRRLQRLVTFVKS